MRLFDKSWRSTTLGEKYISGSVSFMGCHVYFSTDFHGRFPKIVLSSGKQAPWYIFRCEIRKKYPDLFVNGLSPIKSFQWSVKIYQCSAQVLWKWLGIWGLQTKWDIRKHHIFHWLLFYQAEIFTFCNHSIWFVCKRRSHFKCFLKQNQNDVINICDRLNTWLFLWH